ncbi:MAG: anti-virulence regulator CigR family protein [Gemmatimonadota bacterium]
MSRSTLLAVLVLSTSFLVATPVSGLAQGRSKSVSKQPTISVILSPDLQVQIRDFYSTRGASGVKALPPGIRKRLARGKALPPGIAKRAVPEGLRSRLKLPAGYQIIEVGLDVLLVEVATDIVHDVLMDVVR